MVSITKRTNNNTNNAAPLRKKTAVASTALAIVVCVVILWLSCLASFVVVVAPPPPPSEVVGGGGGVSYPSKETVGAVDAEVGNGRRSSSSSVKALADSILTRLDRLSDSVPISLSSSAAAAASSHRRVTGAEEDDGRGAESKFLSASRKECVPGRDDASGEINPTTRRCLRHVPIDRGSSKRRGGW
jgi:hypothetical protein